MYPLAASKTVIQVNELLTHADGMFSGLHKQNRVRDID